MSGTFALDVTRWVDQANGRLDLVVKKIAMDLFSRVILRSPVRSGRFRGNWQVITGETEDVPKLDAVDTSGATTIANAVANVLAAPPGETITLVNSLPYARRLEYGWSQQAPAGMVRITVQEFITAAEQAAAEVRSEGS